MCNGHADTCDITDPNDQYKLLCRCQHHTCGGNCDTCCPGYRQKAWRQSKSYQPFVCERECILFIIPLLLTFSLLPKHVSKKYSCLCPCYESVWGESRGLGPLIHNLGSGRRWEVNPFHWLLYPWGKSCWFPLSRRWGGPYIFLEKRKVPCPCQESNPGLLSLNSGPYADCAILVLTKI